MYIEYILPHRLYFYAGDCFLASPACCIFARCVISWWQRADVHAVSLSSCHFFKLKGSRFWGLSVWVEGLNIWGLGFGGFWGFECLGFGLLIGPGC